jgi:hypothetical protein
LYRRLFDKNHKIQKIDIEQAIDLNYLILSALYCNDFQIDSLKYFQLLKEKSDEGEYALTHSLLALYLLNENACYNFKVLENLKSELISKNLKMLEEHKYEWNDINIESSALLQEVGYKFSKKHIREILKQQQDDGGWKADNNSTQSNAHTTVLALWSISVYLNRLKKS